MSFDSKVVEFKKLSIEELKAFTPNNGLNYIIEVSGNFKNDRGYRIDGNGYTDALFLTSPDGCTVYLSGSENMEVGHFAYILAEQIGIDKEDNNGRVLSQDNYYVIRTNSVSSPAEIADWLMRSRVLSFNGISVRMFNVCPEDCRETGLPLKKLTYD